MCTSTVFATIEVWSTVFATIEVLSDKFTRVIPEGDGGDQPWMMTALQAKTLFSWRGGTRGRGVLPFSEKGRISLGMTLCGWVTYRLGEKEEDKLP